MPFGLLEKLFHIKMMSYGRVIAVLCRPAAILMPWGKYGIMHHVKDYAESRKDASFNVTAQPQSGSSGFQGLGGGTLNKHCAKGFTFALLATIIPNSG